MEVRGILELNITVEQDNSEQFVVTLIQPAIKGFRKEKKWVGKAYTSVETAFANAYHSLYEEAKV